MKQYLDLCKYILESGAEKADRTGTGTLSIFGYQMRFDLQQGFPILTTKKMPFRLILSELLWFIKGDTNIKFLLAHNNHIWDEWAFDQYVKSEAYTGPDMADFSKRAARDPQFKELVETEMDKFCRRILDEPDFAARFGELGRIYGAQWRSWLKPDGTAIDQLANVVRDIQKNPDSRRHLVVAYNPGEVDQMALPPCHSLFQFYVADGKLSCQLYQRSGDVFLGIPFNISSYALLTLMVAQVCGLQPGEFIHTIGDAHIYLNHLEQIKLQLSRDTKPLPVLRINREVEDLFAFSYDDFELEGYEAHPPIKGAVAV